jgi:hypothetical protein
VCVCEISVCLTPVDDGVQSEVDGIGGRARKEPSKRHEIFQI